jgi:CMP/dCMP kinase
MNLIKNSGNMTTLSIIAIDGYSSSGKSTFAKAIAAELDFIYIDSGAMYRAVALYCLENGITEEELPEHLKEIDVGFSVNNLTKKQITLLNGANVEDKIRGVAVSRVVSRISKIKAVREKLVALQRDFAKKGGVVMDGRDIGTVVFPEAGMKIFMNAAPSVRAERRFGELVAKGVNVSYDEILSNIVMRDHEDETRTESPLKKAGDALVLDNSNMTLDEQMNWFRGRWAELKSKSHAD